VLARAHPLSAALASRACTNSTTCAMVNPCASMIASVQPSRQDHSSSSAAAVGLGAAAEGSRHLAGGLLGAGGKNTRFAHWVAYS
jgi:hypothetical protein